MKLLQQVKLPYIRLGLPYSSKVHHASGFSTACSTHGSGFSALCEHPSSLKALLLRWSTEGGTMLNLPQLMHDGFSESLFGIELIAKMHAEAHMHAELGCFAAVAVVYGRRSHAQAAAADA